jgi:hypothetical protein
MSEAATPPSKIVLPPKTTPADVFDMTSESGYSPSVPHPRRRSARPSFSTVGRNTRRGSMVGGDEEPLKLPTLVPGIRPAYSSPLPVLPMIVLCIASTH